MPRLTLIWDLDGTLLDSYRMIVPSLRRYYAERGVTLEPEEIRRQVLESSVRDFAARVEAETGVSLEAGSARYGEIRRELEAQMETMPHARQVLLALKARGVAHCVFTHRGASTGPLLERTGLAGLFMDQITAEDGFPRKPAPEGLLALMARQGLDPAACFYVGDRQLDMDCAHRAGIRGILYRPSGSPVEVHGADLEIQDLRELLELPELKTS